MWASAKDIASASSRYLRATAEFISEEGIEHSAAKILPRRTTVITARGTVGAMVQLGADMSFNQTCYGLVPKEGVDTDFLFYALKATLADMRALSYGTVFDTITTETFNHWRIPLPTLRVQRAIAHILGALDDKIELNRRMSETLETIARAVFKSWFVDFDPVRAKAEGRDTGLPKDMADLFPDRLGDSELGRIPERWEVARLPELVEMVLGGTPSTSVEEYWNGAIPWAAAKDVTQSRGTFVLATERSISQLGLEHSNAKLLPKLTTVVTARGTVGVIRMLGRAMAINQTSYALLPKPGVGPVFNYFLLGSLLEELKLRSYGTVFDTITTNTLSSLASTRPPGELAMAFEAKAGSMFERLLELSLESETLACLRDTLLPKLVSGELRIADPERFLREVI